MSQSWSPTLPNSWYLFLSLVMTSGDVVFIYSEEFLIFSRSKRRTPVLSPWYLPGPPTWVSEVSVLCLSESLYQYSNLDRFSCISAGTWSRRESESPRTRWLHSRRTYRTVCRDWAYQYWTPGQCPARSTCWCWLAVPGKFEILGNQISCKVIYITK